MRAEEGDGRYVDAPPFPAVHVANATWKELERAEARRAHGGDALMPAKQNLVIDGKRLWDAIMETAAVRRDAEGRHQAPDPVRRRQEGARLVQARNARIWAARSRSTSCGNMFAVRPGKNAKLRPIAMGSHLDTQPTGGKFDGVLGVLGALEAMRTLHDARLRDQRAAR